MLQPFLASLNRQPHMTSFIAFKTFLSLYRIITNNLSSDKTRVGPLIGSQEVHLLNIKLYCTYSVFNSFLIDAQLF